MTGTKDSISLDELDFIMNLQRQEAFDDEIQNSPRKSKHRKSQDVSSSNFPPIAPKNTSNLKTPLSEGSLKKKKSLDNDVKRQIRGATNNLQLSNAHHQEDLNSKTENRRRSRSRSRVAPSVENKSEEGPKSERLGASYSRREEYAREGKRPSRRLSRSSGSKSMESSGSDWTAENDQKPTGLPRESLVRKDSVRRDLGKSSRRLTDDASAKQTDPSRRSNRPVDGPKEERRSMKERKPSVRELGERKESKRELIVEQEDSRSKQNTETEDTNLKAVNTRPLGVRSSKSFEKIWGGEKNKRSKSISPRTPPNSIGVYLERQNSDSDVYRSKVDDNRSTGGQSNGGMSLPSDALPRSERAKPGTKNSDHKNTERPSGQSVIDGLRRKTKAEKIVELQEKYERYKKEWIQATKEKNKALKDLSQSKLEVLSLTKEIDTQVSEVGILRQNLADALHKMDKLTDEQLKERSHHAFISKELAQARIDHTRALSEARGLRGDLDRAEEFIAERDRKVASLTVSVENQMEKVDEMEIKLDLAEKEIKKLEEQLRLMEDELIAYRSAFAKENPANGSNSLKDARDYLEKGLIEERERRLDEKQRKLDEQIRDFEEERERYLEKEKQREREEAEKQEIDIEKHKLREEERQKTDEEIRQRLKALEDDNTALQARLKSEQLETAVKLKKKEEAIASLQKEIAQLRKELTQRDAHPESSNKLKEELATIKAQAESSQLDLEEAQKHNGMLQEEIEDLHSAQTELKQEVKNLQKDVLESKKQAEEWKKKAEDWKLKAGEWTEKAFSWKQKAESLEKTSKQTSTKADGSGDTMVEADPAPQALFLQAAIDRKKAAADPVGFGWTRTIGGLFTKGSEGQEDRENETDAIIGELEEENARHMETIKILRSEIVKMQATHKEEQYSIMKKIQELEYEKESVCLKNTNLVKELQLARKLGSLAAQDD